MDFQTYETRLPDALRLASWVDWFTAQTVRILEPRIFPLLVRKTEIGKWWQIQCRHGIFQRELAYKIRKENEQIRIDVPQVIRGVSMLQPRGDLRPVLLLPEND